MEFEASFIDPLNLPIDWKVLGFPDLVFFQEGPGIRNWQYVERDGVRFVNIRCLEDGRLITSKMSQISKEEAYGKYSHFLLDADDFVVSSSGTLGRVATVQTEDLPCCLNTSVIRMRPANDGLERGYLKYFLLSDYYKSQIFAFANGSAQLNYGPTHLKQMEIIAPPVADQKAIAHILGTLDDKIELNRKTNETLEAMAKALFKSWFVDFDPVRAKVEGRPTGLPAEISDLFPDSFEDSELGEIPSGWEVKALDEIAHFLNGLALQKFSPEEGGATLPVIKIAQLKKGDSTGADRRSTSVPAEYVVRDGDVLFSWSGSLAVDIWSGGDGALNQHLFKVTSKTYGKWFYYQWVKFHLPVFQEIAQGKATTMGHIQRHHLSEAKALIPGPSLLAAMDSVFREGLNSAHGSSGGVRLMARSSWGFAPGWFSRASLGRLLRLTYPT